MRDILWTLVLLGMFAVVIAKRLPDLNSKTPASEQVIFEHPRNPITGQVRHVQIVRCGYCHQVISYVEYDDYGIPIGGHIRPTHRCGYKWGSHEQYTGLGFGPHHFNFWNWLDDWQKRLAHK